MYGRGIVVITEYPPIGLIFVVLVNILLPLSYLLIKIIELAIAF